MKSRATPLSSTSAGSAPPRPEVEDVSVFPMAMPMLAGPGAIASIMLLMSGAKAAALGLKPRARFVSFAVGGVAPEVMGIGPVVGTRTWGGGIGIDGLPRHAPLPLPPVAEKPTL